MAESAPERGSDLLVCDARRLPDPLTGKGQWLDDEDGVRLSWSAADELGALCRCTALPKASRPDSTNESLSLGLLCQ